MRYIRKILYALPLILFLSTFANAHNRAVGEAIWSIFLVFLGIFGIAYLAIIILIGVFLKRFNRPKQGISTAIFILLFAITGVVVSLLRFGGDFSYDFIIPVLVFLVSFIPAFAAGFLGASLAIRWTVFVVSCLVYLFLFSFFFYGPPSCYFSIYICVLILFFACAVIIKGFLWQKILALLLIPFVCWIALNNSLYLIRFYPSGTNYDKLFVSWERLTDMK